MNNKWIKIILKAVIIIVLVIIVWFVWWKLKNKDSMVADNIRFSNEYTSITKDNIFKYASQQQILQSLSSEKAVVFFGFPSCKWCQAYVVHLNDIAKEFGVTEILYYNIKLDREKNTEFYNQVVDIIKDYLLKDEEGNPRIYVPDVYFIKSGKIVGHNNDTSIISKMELEDYYTSENITKLQEKLKELFTQVTNCDDARGC